MKPAGRRLVQLDLLRGIAVLMVLLNHRPQLSFSESSPIGPLVKLFDPGYWSGVDLFFVLSGYLVGGLLIAELRSRGRIDLQRFWVRRGLKIWPSYYLYLAFLAVVTALFYVDHSIAGSQWAAIKLNVKKLIYLQNYASPSRPPMVLGTPGAHTWTLAVEEHFYLLLPIVLVLSGRFWRAIVPIVSVSLLIGCLAIRLQSYGKPMNWVWDYQVTHKRIDSLFFGVLLVYLAQTRAGFLPAVKRLRLPLGLLGALLISPMFVLPLGSSFVKTIGYLMLSLGYGCILLAFITTEPGQGVLGRLMTTRAARAVAWVGFWSYSIYLWHMEITHLVYAIGKQVPGAWPEVWFFTYLVASIVAGVFMGGLIEKPVLAWRERYYPSRSPIAAAPEPAVSPLDPAESEADDSGPEPMSAPAETANA